jgi:hypothetical protein
MRLIIFLGLAFWGISLVPLAGAGATNTLFVQVIVGNNSGKREAKWKPAGPTIRARLEPVFRWRKYWETARHRFVVQHAQTLKVEIGEERRVEIDWREHAPGEVRLYHKKQITRRLQDRFDKMLILGGEREGSESWFVVVRPDAPGH